MRTGTRQRVAAIIARRPPFGVCASTIVGRTCRMTRTIRHSRREVDQRGDPARHQRPRALRSACRGQTRRAARRATTARGPRIPCSFAWATCPARNGSVTGTVVTCSTARVHAAASSRSGRWPRARQVAGQARNRRVSDRRKNAASFLFSAASSGRFRLLISRPCSPSFVPMQ